MKIKKIELDKFDEDISKVGHNELPEDEVEQFAYDTLIHEQNITNNEELEDKEKMKEPFYTKEGMKQVGIYVQLIDDNIRILEWEDNEAVKVKRVKNQKDRLRLVIRTRKGWVSLFLGVRHFDMLNELNEKSGAFVFVGGLQTQYRNKRTKEYEKIKEKDEEYDFESYTFNLWQLVHITQKGKETELKYYPKPDKKND